MGDENLQAPALRGRLLTRLGVLVVRHAALVSSICCIAGILSLMLLPVLAKSVYVDENALLPGSARATFTHADTAKAREYTRELQRLVSTGTDVHGHFREWLGDRLDALGAEYYFQEFCPPNSSFSIHAFLSPTHTYEAAKRCFVDGVEKEPGINAVGIIRAARGDGNEAIVLVTPFNLDNLSTESAIAMGLSLAMLELLSRSLWMAKDVIWVAADGKHGNYAAVAAWLKEYHEQLDFTQEDMEFLRDGNRHRDTFFKRAGSITAGFVLEFTRGSGARRNTLKVLAEGSNGQMPNMDMISIVNLLVSWRQQFHLTLDGVSSIKEWQWLKFVGNIFEVVGRNAAQFRKLYLSHSKASYTTADDYVNGVSVLSRSCWNQLLGVPTGTHGAFRDYQLDAITLQLVSSDLEHDLEFLTSFGRLIEGVVRSINNLLEKFHQSLFLYIMVSPNKFVSISTYIIPFGLLLATFPIQAADLSTSVKASHKCWIQSVLLIVAIEIWSLGNVLLPAILFDLFTTAPTRLIVWPLVSATGLYLANYFLKFDSHGSDEWYIPLKSLTLGLTGIALGILSAVNFSVALAGTLILVPLCLSTHPLSVSWNGLWRRNAGALSRVNAILAPVLTIFPLLVVLAMCFWSWIELSRFWGTVLYVSVFMVYLPCSIVCAYIFFS